MTPREIKDMLAALHRQPARVIDRATACAEQLVREGRGTWTWQRAAYAAAASALRMVHAPLPVRPEPEEPWRVFARELLDGAYRLSESEEVFCAGILIRGDLGWGDLTILVEIGDRHGVSPGAQR